MPVTFTPIEVDIVKAINQDEFKDFSYQNADWRCLERGEVPKDDANDGRRALRDDLSVNLKQPLPMTPILSHQSPPNDTVSSTITVVKTDHMPIPHIETKRNPTPSPFQSLHISSSASALQSTTIISSASPVPSSSTVPSSATISTTNAQPKSPSATRSNKTITDQTDI
jgi:hypothetical protein